LTDLALAQSCESLARKTSNETSDRLAPRLQRIFSDLFRYGLCSALALALDWGLLIGLVALGVNYLVASAVSFCAGMVLTYLGSIIFVFPDRRGSGLLAEATGFVAVGLAGLACNQALLWFFVKGFGLNVAVAKAPTTIFVFLFNFTLRRALVFAVGR
jgi:putative flippase GtrA